MTLLYIEGHKLKFGDLISMIVVSAKLLQYRTHPSPYAPCTTSMSGRSAPFSYSHLWSPLHRYIYICTEALMEILGLDPYQSQTQYLEGIFRDFPERRRSGYLSPLCLFSVSTPWEKSGKSGYTVETRRIHVSTFILPIINKPWRIRCQASHFSRV